MSRTAESTQRTKEKISDAMIGLLERKSFDRITIDELVRKAGVGRNSYFRNFQTKEEVISFKLIKLWERYAAENELCERNFFNIDNAYAFFDFNSSIKPLLKTLYCANVQNAVFEAVYTIMLPPEEKNIQKWYREKFYSYGLIGLLDGWVRTGFNETPEEMRDILLNIM